MKLTGKFILIIPILFALLSCEEESDIIPNNNTGPKPEPEKYIEISVRATGKTISTYNADFKEHDEVLIIKSNTDWHAVSSADWLTIKKGEGVLATLKISLNTSGKQRSASLKFKTKDAELLTEITVTQGCTDKISKADFMDMMLIMEENVKDYKYKGYLLYDNDGYKQWLFDAFCFSRNRYNGTMLHNVNVTKDVETEILNEYFESGKYISLLDNIVKEIKPQIPGKFFRKKIIIGIPVANASEWGEIDGVMMSPSEKTNEQNFRAHRTTIAKWFVDEAIERFARKNYENIQLIGFYWHEENGNILPAYCKEVADHIHSYGLNFYWIPYFNAYNWQNWSQYGFDKAWLQPNYLFYDVPESRLTKAYDNAATAGMFLEMEWDALQPLDKHKAYWNMFKEKGILDKWPITYYESGAMFSSRENITDPEWKKYYNTAAKDIAERQKKFYNYN